MGPEWIIVGIIAIAVIFGAKRIPEIAHNVGKAQSEFKKGMREGSTEKDEASRPAPPPESAQPSQPATHPSEQPPPEN